MMQTFQQEMRTLRRAIRHWLVRMGWPRNAHSLASEKLAKDLRLPSDAVSGILDRTADDLRKLSSADQNSIDARPIIDRAVNELSQLGFHSHPIEEEVIDRYLQELPDRDYEILRYFKQGMRQADIAALLDTNVDAVRRSLVKTYAELRVRMITLNDDDSGGGLPLSEQARAGSFNKPLKQTPLRY